LRLFLLLIHLLSANPQAFQAQTQAVKQEENISGFLLKSREKLKKAPKEKSKQCPYKKHN